VDYVAFKPGTTKDATNLAGFVAAAWEVQQGGHGVDVCKPVTTINPWRHCRLNMTDHIFAVCRACYFQLHQLWVVLQSYRRRPTKSLVHAFISCRLDYCNALLYVIADCQLQWLQSVQNTAVRQVTGLCRMEHISPPLNSLD